MEDKVKNYTEIIKLILGAPVRQIELTNEQFEAIYYSSESTFDMLDELGSRIEPVSNSAREAWIFRYMLAESKSLLGRIRGKFSGVLPESEAVLEYKSLLEEAVEEKQQLISLLY